MQLSATQFYLRSLLRFNSSPHIARLCRGNFLFQSNQFSTMALRSSVVVVGGGLAGLTSAIEAYRHGAKITLLEKQKSVGGNSAKATSGINGALTKFQAESNIVDSLKMFTEDTINSGDNLCDTHLVETLVSQSSSAVEWVSSFGVDLSSLVQCGGHSVARTHREPPRTDGKPSPVGWDIIASLKKYVESLPKEDFCIITDASVDHLLLKSFDITSGSDAPDGVRGVAYSHEGKTTELEADAVILCTGGFGADVNAAHSFIREYAPKYQKLPTTNGAFALGEGIRLAREAGAGLVDMDKVQVHPTSFVDMNDLHAPVKFLAPEALRGCGAVLLNAKGERFANELGRRDALSNAIFNQSPLKSTANVLESVNVSMVLNDAAVDKFGRAAFDFYAHVKKFAISVEGYAGLAAHLDVPIETIEATFDRYNRAAKGEESDEFHKKTFEVMFNKDEKLYVCVVTPAIHYCMGGIRFNASAKVLREDAPENSLLPGAVTRRCPIPGLFGVGEVTGGLHGENRLGGNSLLECVVFGRIAGQLAANSHVDSMSSALSKDEFKPLRLRQKQCVSGATYIFTFDLPSPRHVTGLLLGQYIAVRAVLDSQEVIRYYSPISRANDSGVVELLIKCEDSGHMSVHLANLKPDDTLEFRGPIGGLELDLKKKKKLGLIAGGVGISPMIQILRTVFFEKDLDVDVVLIYGAMEQKELVFEDLLREKEKEYKNFKVYFLLNKPPPGWTDGVGFVNREVIEKLCPPPGDDVKIVLCGPPGMCKALKPTLLEMYASHPDNVFSFM